MFNREIMGRVAQAEISVYDAMMQEIYAERNKAKARRMRKPDNRTHEERLSDWENKKDARKWHRFDRDWKLYDRDWKARSECISHAERKIRKAESVARKDWEIEQGNIEVARLDAEIMAEYAEWEARREFEDMCRKLNDWLKYA